MTPTPASSGKATVGNLAAAAGTLVEPPKPAAPLTSVRFDCPDYLDKKLSVKAAEEGVTKTYLIFQALGRAGYRLDEVDWSRIVGA